MRNRVRAKDDFYKTPEPCAKLIEKYLPLHKNWWECCAGDGVIFDVSDRIKFASDLNPRRGDIQTLNVLTCDKPDGVDAVVTNPPFNFAQEIMERLLFDFNLPILFLVRIEFINAMKRKRLQESVCSMDIVTNLIKFETEDGRIINGNGTGRCAWFYMKPEKQKEKIVSWVSY